jgi:dTDP-glucose 4,6-dehydratase
MKQTALVTGSAGFIGSHLSKRLLDEDYDVIGVDNLVTGTKQNIDFLSQFPGFSFIHHDIVLPLKIDRKIDFLFNFACPASPVDFKALGVEIAEVSSIGTKNMLDLAHENKSQFIFASTSEVYGDPLENPQKETYYGNVHTTGIRSPYDEGKRFSEALITAFHRQYDLDIRIVRIFNTYGERMRKDDGRVIPNFIMQALKNKPITLHGDGLQTRSIQYVSDLLDGLLLLIKSNITEPINIGNPIELTVRQIAEKIIYLTNSSSTFEYLPLPQDDPRLRCPDITKAQELLGWKPKINPDDGLTKTIEWFKQH